MRILKGLLAIITVLVIVVGGAWLLWTYSAGMQAGITSLVNVIQYGLPDLDGKFFIGSFLPLLGWALWASLVWSLLQEAIAAAQDRPAKPASAPLRLQRQFAGLLIGAIVAMLTISTVATPAIAANTPAPTAAPAASISAPLTAPAVTGTSHQSTSTAQTSAGKTITTKAGDTLWDLAEAHLGSGERWGELLKLNIGKPQPDGMSLAGDGYLQPGWTLTLPQAPKSNAPSAGAAGTVTVKPGENLSSIAEAHLGSGDRWNEIFAANQDVVQADGGVLTDPSLIQPGWVLNLPGTSPAAKPAQPAPHQEAPAVQPAPPATTHHEAPAKPAAPTAPSTTEAVAPPAAATPAPSRFNTTEPAKAAKPEAPAPVNPRFNTTPSPASSAPAPAPASTPAHQEAAAEQSDEIPLMATGGGILGVLAAGLLSTLAVKRIRQARARKQGEVFPVPTGEEFATEQELVAVVGVTDPRTAVDRALRWLASWAAQTEHKLPSLFAARVTDEALELYLNTASELPAPFVAVAADETAWRIMLDEVPKTTAPHNAPFPALVTLGRDQNGGLLLSDLESLAALTISGPAELTQGAMMAMAIELSVSPWADDLQVTMIGCDRELPDVMDTGRIRHLDTLDDLIADLEGRARQLDKLLATIGATDLAEARSRGTYSENWIPEIVILQQEPAEETRERLAKLVQQVPRVGIATVSQTTIHGQWDLELKSRDSAVLAPDGIVLTPQMISPSEYAHLVGNMRTADLRPTSSASAEELPVVPDDLSSLTTETAEAALEAPETAPEPETDPLAQFNLDAPVLDVLGEVKLIGAAGERPTTASGGGSHLARSTEILTYLALNRGGIDFKTFHKDMWPGTDASEKTQTRNSACSRARRLLGKKDPDTEWFPKVPGNDVYQLHEEVVTTYHHFKALTTDHPERVSTERLVQALKLVRGEPMPAIGRGWGWALLNRNEMRVAIADTATILWERAFAQSDWETAAFAADAGIKAVTYNEDLHRKALQVAVATGDIEHGSEIANALVERIASSEEDAVPEPETLELISAMEKL
ncbi:LysM peptidoglycan-binding domain-containing protein [Arthrobacter woluwensis]|uniref:LysM peptidoglycan-binding domain-containing protein n=1 Tax=Arthrobacter woluwensis TaxID=156980 RepID=UPI00381E31DA